jgi:hypothetical protein
MRIFPVLLVIWMAGSASAQQQTVFGYPDVVAKAEALSKQPFAVQMQDISSDLQNLDYDLSLSSDPLSSREIRMEGFTVPARFFSPGILLQETRDFSRYRV